VLTNTYDSEGNLTNATGVKAVAASGQNHRYQYLQSLLYDKFEQRVQVTQGNGVETVYSYDANTRRLNNLNAVRQGNSIFQNLAYSYDKVGEREAYLANPAKGSRFTGTAIHRATREALEESHPGRFQYRARGPDFLDTATGREIELTTTKGAAEHAARPGYGNATIVTHD